MLPHIILKKANKYPIGIRANDSISIPLSLVYGVLKRYAIAQLIAINKNKMGKKNFLILILTL